MSDDVYSERKNVVANDTQSAKKKTPKLKPSAAGSIWRRRSDEVNERWRLFGTKKRRRERYEVRDDVERVKGIEPSYPAWKAGVLPLNYTRVPK